MNENNFGAPFDGGTAKLQRINNLLTVAHQARGEDDHLHLKSALDGVFSEVSAYLDKNPKLLKEIQTIRKSCEKKIVEYLEWSGSNLQTRIKDHMKQIKQLNMEIDLSDYYNLVIKALKELHMDWPVNDTR